jgi:hypothetical protein
MSVSNFGVKLSRGSGEPLTYTAIAGIRKIDIPEVVSEFIDSTTQSSTAKEVVWSGISGLSEFKVVIAYAATEHQTLHDACKNGTIGDYQIEYPTGEVWTFKAGLKSFKATGADSDSPELLAAECGFIPTGEWTLADPA